MTFRQRFLLFGAGASLLGPMVAAASCGSDPGPVPATDAGLEAAPRVDASVPPSDTGTFSDASVESGTDASQTFGELVPLSGMPADCGLRVVKQPSLGIPAFPWKDCANGIAGCKSFVADWGVPQRNFQLQRVEPVFEDASGTVHVAYRRAYAINPPDGEMLSVVQPMDGAAEVAFRSVGNCAVNIAATPDGLAVVGIRSGSPSRGFVGYANSLDGTAVTMKEVSVTPARTLYQGVTRSSSHVVVEALGGLLTTAALPLGSSSFVAASAGHELGLEMPLALATGYFALADTSPPSVVFAPFTGGNSTVARSVGRIEYHTFDRATNTLVWADKGADSKYTIWASPMATSEAGASPRAVARAEIMSEPRANKGVVLVVLSPVEARLIRLSDGMGWNIPTEPGMEFIAPLWVNDDAVWLHMSVPLPPVTGLIPRAALKIPRASLGPPTIAPGL